jgi:hypothetical protein
MTNYTNNTNNTNNNVNNGIDWLQITAQAMFQGGQVFLETIGNAAPGVDDSQLQTDENNADQRLARAIDRAKQNRANPGPYILSAVRNWSRKQAIAILREKIAGQPIRRDFYQLFQDDLHEKITSLISDIRQSWEQEDEQHRAAEERRVAAQREENEQAFGKAYKYVIGLQNAVLDGERQRQAIFESGQSVADTWASKYETSMRAREQELEARFKLIKQQEQETRDLQLAMRSLAKWDDKRSFMDTVVSTGKNTLGCLLLWLFIVAGILLAIYFAFPAHH